MTENLISRPDWNDYFKEIVVITSKRSICPRLKVGCLFIRENRIIAQGYNGYLPGCDHIPIIKDNHNIATIHAEQNAICDCSKRGVSSDNCIAYITHFPCFNCFKLLVSAGIKSIYYIDDYNNDANVKIIAEEAKVKILKI